MIDAYRNSPARARRDTIETAFSSVPTPEAIASAHMMESRGAPNPSKAVAKAIAAVYDIPCRR